MPRYQLPPGPGRPKGSINKADKNAREAIARFVDGNADKLSGWLDEIYDKDGPKEAFICFSKLIDYHVPKLSRQEISGLDGKDLYPPTPEVDNAILNRYFEQIKSNKEHSSDGKGQTKKD